MVPQQAAGRQSVSVHARLMGNNNNPEGPKTCRSSGLSVPVKQTRQEDPLRLLQPASVPAKPPPHYAQVCGHAFQ